MVPTPVRTYWEEWGTKIAINVIHKHVLHSQCPRQQSKNSSGDMAWAMILHFEVISAVWEEEDDAIICYLQRL